MRTISLEIIIQCHHLASSRRMAKTAVIQSNREAFFFSVGGMTLIARRRIDD